MQSKKTEIWVGLFMLIVLCSVVFICLRVADLSSLNKHSTYQLNAIFDNVGGLKVRSPVKIGGVVVGRVVDISLDQKTYQPKVVMEIDERYNEIPDTSSLSIRTSGLLGEQFLALNMGFYDEEMGVSILKDGGSIQDTKSAMVLEDMIGQFLYKSDSGSDQHTAAAPDATPAP